MFGSLFQDALVDRAEVVDHEHDHVRPAVAAWRRPRHVRKRDRQQRQDEHEQPAP